MLNTKVGWMKKGRGKKSVAIPLMLTSLVDAFSILLIYLIVATNLNSPVEVSPGVELPQVVRADTIHEAPTITIKAKQYFYQNQQIDLAGLKSLLLAKKDFFKDKKAIVEASKDTPYSSIEPLMAMMSELRIESIQLAVAAQESL